MLAQASARLTGQSLLRGVVVMTKHPVKQAIDGYAQALQCLRKMAPELARGFPQPPIGDASGREGLIPEGRPRSACRVPSEASRTERSTTRD